MRNRITAILLGGALAVSVSLPALATEADPGWTGVVYDSTTLDKVQSINELDIRLDPSGENLSATLQYDDTTVVIDAARMPNAANDDQYVAEESTSLPGFNIRYSPDEYFVGAAFTHERSAPNFSELDRLAFTASPGGDQQAADAAVATAAAENVDEMAMNQAALESPATIDDVVPYATGSTYVYRSGLSVPFLISGGFSEGWAYWSTTSHAFTKIVNRIRYAVAYNWPSDGVSLWYDYMNSSQAYHTPAWPSGGTHDAHGTWTIDTRVGALVASTTVSALVNGVPLMWTLYDTSSV